MQKFVARYTKDGLTRSVHFDKSVFDQAKAEAYLNSKGIKNFFFFFEPNPPQEIGENSMLLSGEVGFDITFDIITPLLDQGKEIVLDTFGGNNWEALKIHDHIKALGTNPSIGILGSCMSAGMQILLATENRWMTENSRGLIHNPWAMDVGDDEVFRNGADMLEKEKLQIANIYSKVSGKSLDEILVLMKKETILTASEMLALNFVKSVKGENFNKKVVTNTDSKMNEENKKKLGTIENMLNKVFNKLFPPKNIVLQDVNGVELDFGSAIETPEQIQVGSTATVGGSPAEGEYVMPDGTTYVFETGAITEIRMPETTDPLAQENAQLKEQIAELESQLQNSVDKVQSLNGELESMRNEFKQVKDAFTAFKNEFSKEEPTLQEPPKTDEPVKKFSFKIKKN